MCKSKTKKSLIWIPLVLGLLISISLAMPAWASIINVGPTWDGCNGPCNMIDLGLAVELANEGDIVKVYPGIYYIHDVVFNAKYVSVEASSGDPNDVLIKPLYENSYGFIIDSGGYQFNSLATSIKFVNVTFKGFKTYAVKVNGWEFPPDLVNLLLNPEEIEDIIGTVEPIFEGCIFRNNTVAIESIQNTTLIISDSQFLMNETAIKGENTSLILDNNIFVKNASSEGGGAILIDGDSGNPFPISNTPTLSFGTPSEILDNIFYDNYQAISINNAFWDLIISGNNIRGTLEGSTAPGISVTNREWNSAIISNNTVILQNGPGIVFSSNQDALFSLEEFVPANSSLDHNIIAGNAGVGIDISDSSPNIYNNTIADNASDGLLMTSGGLSLTEITPSEIYNNIIVNNAGAGMRTNGYNPLAQPQISYNDVWNNTEGDYVGNITSGGEGAISVDPVFPGAELYFYELGIDSPCVDAGKTTEEVENDPDGTLPDMGAIFQDQSIDVYYAQAMAPDPALSEGDFMDVGLFIINRSGESITESFGHFCFNYDGTDCQFQVFNPQPDFFDVTVGIQADSFTTRSLEIVPDVPYGGYILQTAGDFWPSLIGEFYFYVLPSLSSDAENDGSEEESNQDDTVSTSEPSDLGSSSDLDSNSGGCMTVNTPYRSSDDLLNLTLLICIPVLFIVIRRKYLGL